MLINYGDGGGGGNGNLGAVPYSPSPQMSKSTERENPEFSHVLIYSKHCFHFCES